MKKLFFIPIAIMLFTFGLQSAAASSLEFSQGSTLNNFTTSVYQCTTTHSLIASSTVPVPLNPFVLDKIGFQASGKIGTITIGLKVNGTSVGTKTLSGNFADFSNLAVVLHPLDYYEVVVNTSNFSGITLKSTIPGSFTCISTGGDHSEDDTSYGVYTEFYGSQTAGATLYVPAASSTIPDFKNWVVSGLAGVPMNLGINYRNDDLGLNYSDEYYYSSLVLDDHHFAIIKTHALPDSSLWRARVYMWSYNNFNFDYYGPWTYFTIDSASSTPDQGNPDNVLAYKDIVATTIAKINAATSTPFFTLDICPAGSGFLSSSTLNEILCNGTNTLKSFVNFIVDAISAVMVKAANLLSNMFPINVFYHLNTDIAAVQALGPNSANSNATLAVPFGNTEIVFLSSTTIDAAGAAIGFNFREKFDYFMYIMTGAFMILVGGWTFVHFKNKHKNNA